MLRQLDSPPVRDALIKENGLMSDAWQAWFNASTQVLNDLIQVVNQIQGS